MKTRLALAIAVLCLAPTACGGSAPQAPDELLAESAAEGGISLAGAGPASPAFVVAPGATVDDALLSVVDTTPGVMEAAPLRVERVEVTVGDGDPVTVTVGTVRGIEFRPVAPEPSRGTDFVWRALLGGEAVVSFEAARRLGVDAGERVAIRGADLPVGAVADTTAPVVADVLVDRSVGERLGVDDTHLMAVAARPGAPIEELAARLHRRLPEAQVLPLLPGGLESGDAPEDLSGDGGGSLVGRLSFEVVDDGFIDPDPAWEDANIVRREVPIVGEVVCHRLMLPQLEAALEDVAAAGLAGEIRAEDYGGCYVPRFIDRNPELPLSMHAFGLAIDFNTTTNQLGTPGDMSPEVVRIFERRGFVWGGDWSRPDPMHFELGRVESAWTP